MEVAVMFSGGKDSVQAVKYCLDKGWDIRVLLAVKPTSTESYLYHYPCVEWCRLHAEALNIPVKIINVSSIGPRSEAEEMDSVFKGLDVDAIVLGGVGLQKTQIRELNRIAKRYKIKTLIPYRHLTSEQLLREEIKSGFDIRIIDVASDGLGREWIGQKLDGNILDKFVGESKKFGFDVLGEGGYYNTFVVDGPGFKKRIEILESRTVWDNETESGYMDIKEAVLQDKN